MLHLFVAVPALYVLHLSALCRRLCSPLGAGRVALACPARRAAVAAARRVTLLPWCDVVPEPPVYVDARALSWRPRL
ncbi:unnamed protein product [Urochloa humidicola]